MLLCLHYSFLSNDSSRYLNKLQLSNASLRYLNKCSHSQPTAIEPFHLDNGRGWRLDGTIGPLVTENILEIFLSRHSKEKVSLFSFFELPENILP